MIRRLAVLTSILLLAALLAGCVLPEPSTYPEEMPTEVEEQPTLATPDIVEGMFNVAFVYVGPIGDGGWTYAHNDGRLYLEANLDNVNTVYLESVPEGADAERVIRSLARKGFDLIFTTSFGYMDPTAIVAEEFPDQAFVHVSGLKKNDHNFANLFGSMESAKYLAGMVAGAKAAEDGSNRVGYVAPFPIPEIIRLGNALTMGMRRTCPECVMDVRWIFSWFDPEGEREAAVSMIDAGATVIITGADTAIPVQVADEMGFTGVPGNSANACDAAPEACLGVPYWNWGPVYARIAEAVMDGTFEPDDYYLGVPDKIVGFAGFMEGEVPQPAVPDWVIPEVDDVLQQMRDGEFTRFDMFTGPIHDNAGNLVVPESESLTQSDLEGIDDELGALLGRPGCTYCMGWLAEGFVADAQVPQ